jgi:hypothetical protein
MSHEETDALIFVLNCWTAFVLTLTVLFKIAVWRNWI